MTVPKLRNQMSVYSQALQHSKNSRSRAQGLFFLAVMVAAILFVNNVTNMSGAQYQPYYGSLLTDSSLSRSTSVKESSSDKIAGQAPPNLEVQPLPPVAPKASNPVDGELNGEDEPRGNDDEAAKEAVGDESSNNNGEEIDTETIGQDGASDSSKLPLREQYAHFDAPLGILSDTPFDVYLEQHKEIDEFDNTQRCRRYGYSFSKGNERNRRLFYGSVLMDEPWELLEILAAESYGLFEAMVFVEPDHDYYGEPRTPLRLGATDVLKSMFGVDNVRVIKYSPENPTTTKGELMLDSARNTIVKEWKDMGMTVDDVGYVSGIDTMFARDYINSVKHCELPEMKYDLHHCLYNRVKVFGNCQVYETSPDCVSRTKDFRTSAMMIGACIEGIGDESAQTLAPRDETGIYRDKGWNCEDRETEKDIKDSKFPLWSGSDIHGLCGGRMANLRAAKHQQYTAFHFRNFYNTARDMRLMVTTEEELYDKSMDDLGEDPMRVTYRCMKEIPDEQNAVIKREPGGFSVLKPMTPLYFANDDYRTAAHERGKKKVLDDETMVNSSANGDAKVKKDESNTKTE